MDHRHRQPEPRGFRDPPRRVPPTAVGAATPDPDGEPSRPAPWPVVLLRALRPVFDAVDSVRRSVARGLR